MANQLDDLQVKITAAMQALTAASNDPAAPDGIQDILDDTILALQKVQNNITEQSEQALLDALKSNNNDLKKLNDEMDEFCKKLDKITKTIKKVSSTIGTVISVITTIVSVGIL